MSLRGEVSSSGPIVVRFLRYFVICDNAMMPTVIHIAQQGPKNPGNTIITVTSNPVESTQAKTITSLVTSNQSHVVSFNCNAMLFYRNNQTGKGKSSKQQSYRVVEAGGSSRATSTNSMQHFNDRLGISPLTIQDQVTVSRYDLQ